MMEKQEILKINELSIGYGKSSRVKPILSRINLSAGTSQLISLMGANGTGKSTLLRTICGIQPALSGEVLIEGQSIHNLSVRQLATLLSVVLTERIQPGYMTVSNLVAMGRHPHTDWRGRLLQKDLDATNHALEITGLNLLSNHYPHTLSDGQLQKAMIARALAQDGHLMLLDEPLIHLDIPSKREIVKLLQRTARESGKTIIMATHELELSLKTADRLWLIDNHRKIIDGTPEELIANGVISATFD